MHLQRLRETNDSDRLGGKPIDGEAFFDSLRRRYLLMVGVTSRL
jgi:hypothetical protein